MAFGEKVSDFMGGIIDTLIGREGDFVDDIEDVMNEGRMETVGSAIRKPVYVSKTNDDRKVVTSLNNYKEHEVKIVEPRSFGDTKQVVNHLLDNRTVVLNLHLLDKEQSQRTIDFVCGASFALGGAPQKVGDTVFVFTPQSVQLSVESKETTFGTESLWGGNL